MKYIFILMVLACNLQAQKQLEYSTKANGILIPKSLQLFWGKDTFSTEHLSEYFMSKGMGYTEAITYEVRVISYLWGDGRRNSVNMITNLDHYFKTRFHSEGWDDYIDFIKFKH